MIKDKLINLPKVINLNKTNVLFLPMICIDNNCSKNIPPYI